MGLFDNWPYSDVHQLNLDWILKVIKEIKGKTDEIDGAVETAQQAAEDASQSEIDAAAAKNAAILAASNAQSFYNQVLTLTGSAVIANTAADMTDTDSVYLYVGSEAGYNNKHWYYYDGNDWVDGGLYGSLDWIGNNAVNLLDYVLKKVAYTQTGMSTYVEALIDALRHTDIHTTFTITNALSHITTSNVTTGIDYGDGYSAVLTPESGYHIDTVSVTMGGTDITASAYAGGVITITNVTGNVVITAVGAYTPVLPSTYQAVEYIAASGTQYLNTGVTLTNDSVRIAGRIMATATNTNNMMVCGVRAGTNAGQLAIHMQVSSAGTGLSMNTGNHTGSYNVGTWSWLNPILNELLDFDGTLDAGNSSTSNVSITFEANNDSIHKTGSGTSGNNAQAPFRIFGAPTGGDTTKFKGRIYSLTVWNNNVKVIEAVPCYRINDSVIGMYDLVTQNFWTNAGSGTFTKGSDI